MVEKKTTKTSKDRDIKLYICFVNFVHWFNFCLCVFETLMPIMMAASKQCTFSPFETNNCHAIKKSNMNEIYRFDEQMNTNNEKQSPATQNQIPPNSTQNKLLVQPSCILKIVHLHTLKWTKEKNDWKDAKINYYITKLSPTKQV